MLVEKKLVVSLDSKVAQINREGSDQRYPDVKGNPKREGPNDITQFTFPFRFTFTYDSLFQSVKKLGDFNPNDVNDAGSSTWVNNKFELILFVPVNHSGHANKVSKQVHEMYDFASVMNFNTALLYCGPLPYEFGFKKYQQDIMVYIN